MLRNLLALASAFLLALPLAHADQASKRAKIQEMITLTNSEQMMNQMLDQMSAVMKSAATRQAAKYQFTPEQQQIQDKFNARISAIIAESLSMDKIRPIILQTYDETYSEEEIDGILNFYRSPIGKAFLAKTPQLMTRTMTLMQQKMMGVQPQLEQATKDLANEMSKTSQATEK
ncbi:MAG: hypothetical protein NVSMB3_00020 [Acidobacteriaceae bacterium]